jgi:hypothetical protein
VTGKRGAGKDAGAAQQQVSIEDDAHMRRNEAMVRRLDQMGALVDDLLARLPAWRREIDAMKKDLRSR